MIGSPPYLVQDELDKNMERRREKGYRIAFARDIGDNGREKHLLHHIFLLKEAPIDDHSD
jgi:hypothetical protein